MMTRLLAVTPVFAGLILAQSTDSTSKPGPLPALKVQRAMPESVPSPQTYPFAQLIGIAADSADPVPVVPPKCIQPSAAGRPIPVAPEPVPSLPVKDVPLPPMAVAALDVSRAWMSEKHAPAAGKDGRVLYTYGAGLATLVCAPLRICTLELESGETITGEPQIGDSVRWIISPASIGRDGHETPIIVIKPKQSGLDTTLLITTDRRAYYLRLVSKPEEFLARVAFSYPEDEVRRWRAHIADQEQRHKHNEESSRITPIQSIEQMYFDYRIVGGDVNLRPLRVIDDGSKTYIQMSPNVTHREAPVLVVVGTQGAEMVNYRVKGDMYIVDRLIERGALLLGAGKKAQRVEIVRGTYQGKVKGDPYKKVASQAKESPQ